MFILIVFPLYLLPRPNRKQPVGLTLGFVNTPFLAMIMVPRQQWHGHLKIKHLSYIEEVYNSLKVLSWHLSRLIFYRVVIPAHFDGLYFRNNDCFQCGEKPPQTD